MTTDPRPGIGHVFFDPSVEADREAFQRLVALDPRIEIFDRFRLQIAELIETREPQLAREELDGRIGHWLDGRELKDAGTWVYYPWSHRLVHLLSESDFAELRTDRNRYKITPEEQRHLATRRIGVVGLSVGQSVAVALAMERSFGELRLADFDYLGLSNLNRLRSGVHNLGVLKTELTAREIAEIDPYLHVTCFPEGVSEQNMDQFFLDTGQLDVLIDECDDLTMKILVRRRARELGIPVVMETSDRGMIDIERFDLHPKRPIFHGLIEDLDPETLRGLSTHDKVPYVLKIVGDRTISTRMIASMMEVGHTIKTWPQLASAVVLGGGLTADVVRRILLGQISCSGRYFADLDRLISDDVCHAQGSGVLDVVDEAPSAVVPLARPRSSVEVSETTSPHSAGDSARDEATERIVALAVTAPSGANLQPWRWISSPHDLSVRLSTPGLTSSLTTDFQDTAAIAALGAATENAVIAAHAEGFSVRLTPFPHAGDERAVAALAFSPSSCVDDETREFDELLGFITKRETNRRLGIRRVLPGTVARALDAAVESIPAAGVHWLTSDEELEEAAALIGSGDRIRFLNRELHAEVMREIRWTREEVERSRDGLDIETFELTPADRAGLQLCRSPAAMQFLNRIGGGAALEKGSRRSVAAASAVGLITMASCDRADFFRGGRAFQRLWLTATAHSLALQPLSTLPYLFARLLRSRDHGFPDGQVRQLLALRQRYRRLFDVTDDMAEVLLFRIGYAGPARARSLRRPVRDILEFVAGGQSSRQNGRAGSASK